MGLLAGLKNVKISTYECRLDENVIHFDSCCHGSGFCSPPPVYLASFDIVLGPQNGAMQMTKTNQMKNSVGRPRR